MFAILILFISIFLLTVSVLSYYKYWREFGRGKLSFALVAVIIVGIMLGAVMYHKAIPTEVLRRISLFISAVSFIVIMYSSVLFVVRWIVISTAKVLKRTENKFSKFVMNTKKCVSVILAFTFLLGVAGFANMSILRTSNFDVKVDIASDTKKLNCVVVSDTHLGVGLFSSQLDELVDKINACNPDVVFLVGDIIDESTLDSEFEKLEKSFSNIKSEYGTYFVYGNHESYSGNDPAPYLEAAGVTVLRDETAIIAGDITVIGRADGYGERMELSEIIEQNKVDTSKPIIVLNHEPLLLNEMAKDGADVSISGHTHGEQFPLTKNLFSLANDMMYGVEDFSGMSAVTTSGAAGWGFHYKLPAKSEVMNLTIEFK